MTATFTALLLAHLLADFVLQTGAMVRGKGRAGVFALHVGLVFATSLAALGGAWHLAAAVTAAHAAIDAAKTWALPEAQRGGLPAYLGDQAAHLATLVAAAWWMPGAFAAGLWAQHAASILPLYALMAGLIGATLAGAPLIRGLMVPFASGAPSDTLPDAGRMIGILERALIFVMVLIGEPAGIGFLIAAKSVLRFDAASRTQYAEYVIIGTLGSFGWAIAVSVLTRHAALPLGFAGGG